MDAPPTSADADAHLVSVVGVLIDKPIFGSLSDGARFANCLLRPCARVGCGPLAENTVWPLIIHRQPAVELLRAAMPGDILQLRGVVERGRLVAPRTGGRLDVFLVA